jgi:hypothetical protein
LAWWWNGVPRSSTSGARSWPRWLVTAFSSSWLEPSGSVLTTSMPYFSLNVSIISP